MRNAARPRLSTPALLLTSSLEKASHVNRETDST